MPTMPNVVGLEYAAAQLALQQAGVLDLSALGYFSAFPILASWQPSNQPPSTVIAQSPSSSTTVAANSTVTLTMAEFPTGVAFP